MRVSLPHIAARIFGRPLLIDPRKAEMLLAILGERIGIDAVDVGHIDSIFRRARLESPAANRMIGEPGGPYDQSGRRQLLYNVHNGVALIPIVGTLVNRGAFVGDDGSGAVSYEGLATQIAAAGQDRDVHSILLDIDSPGGEANGMAALADIIRSARAAKPVTRFTISGTTASTSSTTGALTVAGGVGVGGSLCFPYAASNPGVGPAIKWSNGTYGNTLGL